MEPNLHRRRPEKDCNLSFLFPHVFETAQPDNTRRDSSFVRIILTLSRIDRIFTNLPVAEVRVFHCNSHVFENLGNRTIPSDHAAVCMVIHKLPFRGQQGKSVPSCMSKHPVFCSILKLLYDGHQYSADPFGALAEPTRLAHSRSSKLFLKKAKKKQTVRELSRKTPDSLGAKLLTASTA